ncbi:riboflavin-binding protein-like [Sycon ciliatum]|uniref:riboflavin-binding protein-like n=1 Tax=Sycon ciliatum TaxID=27933 RepID=UPI0031F5FDC5
MASATSFVCFIVLSLALSCFGQDCPFFGTDRKPTPKTNLGNCTWYEYSSCCERAEVSAVFAEMLSLQGASQACRNRVNYMMCYFCDPRQRTFLVTVPRQASICSDFCDETYNECSGALHNGMSLSSRYATGKSFCEANFFRYGTNTRSCMPFNASAFSAASHLHTSQYSTAPMLLVSAGLAIIHSLF